jgi:hypothetical protein
MAMIDWRLQGHSVSTCSCSFGCPCQFMSLPTHGHCQAAVANRIVKGHFGKVALDGLCFGGIFAWPGPIHEGHGQVLPIVDERASPEQRDAILAIMTGAETEPGATIFNVFAATFDKVHDPVFRRIDFTFDLERREASFSVPGLIDAGVEPIRNPMTNAPIPARLVLPDGFEFISAEFASGQVRTHDSPIALQWSGTHAHLFDLDMTGKGPVRH